MGVIAAELRAVTEGASWQLLDAVPDAILIVDIGGRVVFANSNALDLLGWSGEDVLGIAVEELLPQDARNAHPAHRARYFDEPTPRSMGAGTSMRAVRRGGEEIPVEINLSPLRLGGALYVVAGIRDITEWISVEDHLHRVLHTLDASDDGVFIFDAGTLRFSYVNDGATRRVGYPREELLSMTPLHVMVDAREHEFRTLAESMRDGSVQASIIERTFVRKDGVEVPLEIVVRSAPEGRDGSTWLIALARDMSERIESEEKLRASRDALREAEQVLAVAGDRERIARDLHDTVIQRIFAAGLGLQALMPVVDSAVAARIDSTIDGLDETIRELRSAIFALQTAQPLGSGLRGRFVQTIAEIAVSLGFEPSLKFAGRIDDIGDTVAAQLVPTLREALSNIARHAHATRVAVSLAADDVVVLTVTDDGGGLPAPASSVPVAGEGHGLVNMTSRAQELGGSFEITELPSGGTRLTWTVPFLPSTRSPTGTARDAVS